ncbi:hypothetical protein EHM92_01415 [bacterium]|nr:MAG: hypothetical protein EHM92_01415 [bacterium]
MLGCTQEKPKFTTVYVFVDVTDSLFRSASHYLTDIPLILRKMNIDTVKGGYDGAELRLFLINDLSESKSTVRRLEEGTPGMLGQNPLDRLDEVRRFSRGIGSDFVSLLHDAEWQKNQSKIYQNLCRELNNLARANSNKKAVIIYSDMLENSNLFSFYGPGIEKVHAYIEDMNRARRELTGDCEMPDLSGVELNIVTLRTKANDEKVNLASQFWTRFLQQQRALVRFGSELREE